MKPVKLDDPNALQDARHLLGSQGKEPSPEGGLDIATCYSCRKIMTEYEWRKFGCCPNCRGLRVSGGKETLWESLKLKWWMATENWRVTGFKNDKRPLWKRVLGLSRPVF